MSPLILGARLAFVLALAPAAAAAQDIIVADPTALAATLADANSAGKTIHLLAQDYPVTQALIVPNGTTLIGAGVMTYDPSGRPAGFADGTRSRLIAAGTLAGDILTLGNGASVARVAVEDVAGRFGGNLVVVSSRRKDDVVSARIDECELVNPNYSSVAFNGPGGRALAVITRNPRELDPPAPHAGSSIAAAMSRSIVRSLVNASCVFAINFAPQGHISVTLEGNVLGGGLDANGGVSRPFTVTGSRTSIVSRNNLYRSDSETDGAVGWGVTGSSGPPVSFLTVGAASYNSLSMRSENDRLEGFVVGIYAAGAKRFFGDPIAGPSNDNRLDLEMEGTRIRSVFVDAVLFGVESAGQDLIPGDRNVLHVSMHDVESESVGVVNFWGRAAGPEDLLSSEFDGTGNRLEGNYGPFVRGH